LGAAKKVEKVTIRWPSGLVETMSGLAANQFYVVREGQGIDPAGTHGVSHMNFPLSDRTSK
jgi:enediyne biosynthesis protein E4